MADSTVGVKRKSPPSPAKPPSQAAAAPPAPEIKTLSGCRGIAHTNNDEWADEYKKSVGPNRLVDALHAKTVASLMNVRSHVLSACRGVVTGDEVGAMRLLPAGDADLYRRCVARIGHMAAAVRREADEACEGESDDEGERPAPLDVDRLAQMGSGASPEQQAAAAAAADLAAGVLGTKLGTSVDGGAGLLVPTLAYLGAGDTYKSAVVCRLLKLAARRRTLLGTISC